ncbi:MAG: hypothetical protein FWG11_00485 [Promicromonosporaceae bacterium]|nr:hypothetical protein [Promicromonosporaceae bacterium]
MSSSELPITEPWDGQGIFDWLHPRAIPGVEASATGPDGTRSFARALSTPFGPAVFHATWRPGAAQVRLAVTAWPEERPPAAAGLAADGAARFALGRARRLFSLDYRAAESQAADAFLSRDPRLAPLVAATPGIRIPDVLDPAEYLTRVIVGQQISVAAATTHLARLTARLGQRLPATDPPDNEGGDASPSRWGLTRLFPTQRAIATGLPVAAPGTPAASDPDRPLRLASRQVATVVRAAQAVVDGSLDLTGPLAAARAALAVLPGIGPWSVEYLAMRALRDPDAWPIGDVALLKGAERLGLAASRDLPPGRRHRELAARAEEWAPFRSYAACHLWAASQGEG